MNRANLQQLANDRIDDARALLAASRWSGAYYLAGYAIECGLKSTILRRIEDTGHIFRDKKFAERCWTHDLPSLLDLAELKPSLGQSSQQNSNLGANWLVTAQWSEMSRYNQWTEMQAEELVNAVDHATDGVLPWIRNFW